MSYVSPSVACAASECWMALCLPAELSSEYKESRCFGGNQLSGYQIADCAGPSLNTQEGCEKSGSSKNDVYL